MISTTDILAALHQTESAALAVISLVDGPSYRPLGAMMAIDAEGQTTGMLSSGCIEADVVQHALRALDRGQPTLLRYGNGSPFFDIQLPCGGGLEICVLPRPDQAVIDHLIQCRARRATTAMSINVTDGAIAQSANHSTYRQAERLNVCFEPPLRFLVFGKGPEAVTFASLLAASDYDHLLVSNDPETLAQAAENRVATALSPSLNFPDGFAVDHRTAVTLFFHDHEVEPGILAQALETKAFYIGAQGSQRARAARDAALVAQGVTAPLDRLRGPIGLIPSTRDPRTLSVSVLAEILALANTPE
ncbi:XdhC family protein [Cognatishimia sp. SS12]|uniref:XdhC family protein n=1 Tax=Cognatishimia sp. SS12 TaxID=2979465 RepID=UPI00232DF288|nr:XdhC family protein [Cognatishimia sp. SS12]MDC0739585.1 XdhC family protein [Cognatishimia sp. SS12]